MSVTAAGAWVLGPGPCPCSYLSQCPVDWELAAEGTSAREDTFPPLCPRTENGHLHISLPKCCTNPGPPSDSLISFYPSESSHNNQMGLIIWLLSQLRVSIWGRDWEQWKHRDGEGCYVGDEGTGQRFCLEGESRVRDGTAWVSTGRAGPGPLIKVSEGIRRCCV